MRITDKLSGTGAEPATLGDLDLRAAASCAATAGSEGATCSLITSLDAITPGIVPEGRRSRVGAGPGAGFDSGADGNPPTQGDNTLFATQGVFIP